MSAKTEGWRFHLKRMTARLLIVLIGASCILGGIAIGAPEFILDLLD